MEKRGKTLRHIEHIYLSVIYLMLASLIFAAIYAYIFKNYTILFSSMIVGLVILIPHLFRWKYKITIPLELELIVLLFIYGTLFLGEALSFYSIFWWWDILLHGGSALIFGFIGFIILFFLYSRHQVKSKPQMLALFSFSFAIAIGVVWEIFEFFMDTTFGFNMQASGLVDTMGDLIVDTIGAIIASAIGYAYLRIKHTLIFKEIVTQVIKQEEK
ncbi:MAG: hypothetical protein WCI72_04110 [archaeon]